uniref:Activin_recp domain-containing protein n=1 Tax=Syphacia muris TaxID=451379 RepID=A0A0N5AED0_9BILA
MFNLKLFFLIAFVGVCFALKCKTGRQLLTYGNDDDGDFKSNSCPSGTTYCLKTRSPSQYSGELVEKSCDVQNHCYTIGPGCRYDQNTSIEVCCCNDNNCNGVGTIKASLLLTIILATIQTASSLLPVAQDQASQPAKPVTLNCISDLYQFDVIFLQICPDYCEPPSGFICLCS